MARIGVPVPRSRYPSTTVEAQDSRRIGVSPRLCRIVTACLQPQSALILSAPLRPRQFRPCRAGASILISRMKILACNSNRPLAEAISSYLNLPLTKASVRRFSDMEIFVEIQENVRGEDVFVIQSTSYPVNDNLMELLITLDALKRSSARRVTAVIPYYGYARQDRKSAPRTPISAKLVANMITAAGADRVLTVDLHAGQIQGFFDIPTDNLFVAPVFIKDIKERHNGEDLVIVSPDVGGVVRARAIAKRLDADLAIIDKR